MAAHLWTRLRRAILDRDGWQCQRCGMYGRLEVHHRDGDPGLNTLDNLETLCRSCHIRHHAPAVTPAVAAWRELVDEAERTLYGKHDAVSLGADDP